MNALRRELLQSVVGVARAIFLAEAASVAILDHETGEFVFMAVAGRGEEIVGTRFAAGKGLAGMVAQSGEALIVDDLAEHRGFDRDIAESTGYVPSAMMVAPLIRDERTLGVLSVLDRGATGRGPLEELDLLARFADQAAVSLQATDSAPPPASAGLTALAQRLAAMPEEHRRSAERVFVSLADLLVTERADDDTLER